MPFDRKRDMMLVKEMSRTLLVEIIWYIQFSKYLFIIKFRISGGSNGEPERSGPSNFSKTSEKYI
jgi:hypothetical protein